MQFSYWQGVSWKGAKRFFKNIRGMEAIHSPNNELFKSTIAVSSSDAS